MTEINPINNENDLHIETDASAVKSTVEQPIIHPPTPPNPISINVDKGEHIIPNQINVAGLEPSAIRIESQLINSRINSVEDNIKPFAYRLPVFSYVLAWFYIVATMITLIFFITTSISYFDTINSYKEYSSMYESYGVSVPQPSYGNVFMPFFIILAYCIAMTIFLLSARKIMRYIGIFLSIGVVGYAVYELIKAFGPIFNDNLFSSMMSSMSFSYLSVYVVYLPYALLPIVATVYLFTPTASRAYK